MMGGREATPYKNYRRKRRHLLFLRETPCFMLEWNYKTVLGENEEVNNSEEKELLILHITNLSMEE